MEKQKYSNKYLLKKFIPYYGPYKKTLICDLLAASLTTLSELVLPLLLSYLTDWAQIGVLDQPRIIKVAIIYVFARLFLLWLGILCNLWAILWGPR